MAGFQTPEVTVPNVPGVPPVNFSAASALLLPGLLLADAVDLFLGVASPAWGIFLGATMVVSADQVTSFEYKQEYVIADFPLEKGAFQSYDKVQVPFEPRVRFATGGSEADRTALLGSIQAIVGDLNLYDVVTPTAVYPSCNVIHQDYRRTAQNGVGLIQVDVWLREVRITGSASSPSSGSPSNTLTSDNGKISFEPVDPTAAPPVNAGTVQPVGPPQNFPGQP